MLKEEKKTHWEQIYQRKSPLEVSWFETNPSMSLELIEKTKLNKEQRIIDVGGGASMLVDCLFNAGFKQLAVLDISAQSLQYSKTRLGETANQIEWYETDVTAFQPVHPYELWHDRVVFHFLTHAEDRKRYVRVLKNTLVPNGHLIIATFAIDGPSKCSGLDIVQYDAPLLCAEIGEEFELLEVRNETHITPANVAQKLTYFRFKRRFVSLFRV
jgi:2-polyprenyl-3-methyl-5-hydroxy-6-metoxy-1,4-benzoquinol methylase